MAFELSRIDRLIRTYDLSTIPLGGDGAATPSAVLVALLPPRSGPSAGTVWTTVTYAAGIVTVLLAGPDADSTGAVVVPASADLWMKVVDSSEVDAVKVERITVLGGGSITALPAPGVASVNDKTGAVTLTATDVGAQPSATLAADTAAHVADGSALDVALKAALVAAEFARHEPLIDDIRRGKGGTVGVQGKAVICFRADHGVDDFIATFWPLFKARGIPVSLGVVTRAIGSPTDPYEPTTTTWPTLRGKHLEGFEVWSHSATHLDPDNTGLSLDEEIVGSKQTIEANGIKCMGWQSPGVDPPPTYPHYSTNFTFPDSWSSDVGRMFLSNYGLIEHVGNGASRRAPAQGGRAYGTDHITMDSRSLTALRGDLEQIKSYKLAAQFIWHPRFMAAGNTLLTTANLASFLDDIKAAWDAGEIEVVTPSAMPFLDPTTDYRFDLLRNTRFLTLTRSGNNFVTPDGTATWGIAGGSQANLDAITLETSAVHDGTRFLRLPATASFAYVGQTNPLMLSLHCQGFTFIAEGWCRAPAASAQARMFILDGVDSTRLNLESYWDLPAGSQWTKVRMPFTVPANTDSLQIRVARRGGDTVDWDGDLHIYPA